MNRFLVYLFAAFYGLTQAQGVLISNQAGLPDSSAILELADTTKGFLPTRLTTNQRNAISNPAEGLIIFNTDSKCFEGKTPSGTGHSKMAVLLHPRLTAPLCLAPNPNHSCIRG